MVIYGVALLALCTLGGIFIGEGLGRALGIPADIGGVGFAMILLVAARAALSARGLLAKGLVLGVEFWAAMYIPIIVAMAAQEDVVSALRGGPVVLLASVGAFALCLAACALLCRFGGRQRPEDRAEPRASAGGGAPR